MFFFKQKTAYEMRISDWSSDVCSSDLECSRMDRRIGVSTVGPLRGQEWHSAEPPPAEDQALLAPTSDMQCSSPAPPRSAVFCSDTTPQSSTGRSVRSETSTTSAPRAPGSRSH